MIYRRLGKTGLEVSEIGLGAEWLERHDRQEVKEIIDYCEQQGINILDCWMSEPNVRSNIGAAIAGKRERWIIQGHIGSTWQNGQYVRTRNLEKVKPAFEDLLSRLGTDYIDLGMIHFVDEVKEFHTIMEGEFWDYVCSLKASGAIRHIGMSTHNPAVARLAAESGVIEMILFSINPAFDLLPASEHMEDYFKETYDEGLRGIHPDREALYKICEQNQVGITVMKGYAGGRLFEAAQSPFGVALTPVQCLHYALTRPAVASVMVGYDSIAHVDAAVAYETATEEQKDYASVLAHASAHAYYGQCTYCGHCAPCPAGIDIAMVNKLSDLAKMQTEVPASLRAHYRQLAANAADCTQCGGCEKRCPFGVPVVRKMAETAALFKEYKAVFLDYTGTIAQEESEHIHKVIRHFCTHSDIHDPKKIVSYVWKEVKRLEMECYGDKFMTEDAIVDQILDDCAQKIHLTGDFEVLHHLWQQHWTYAPAFEDVHDFFEKCPLPIYVITNDSAVYVEESMRDKDLHPMGIISSESVRAFKPHPEIFEKALEVSGCKPSEVLHVGDSYVSDVEGARAAGIDAILVDREGTAQCPENTVKAVSLMEVFRWL